MVDDRVRPLAKYPLRFAELRLSRAERPYTVPPSTGRGSTISCDRKRRSACHPTIEDARQTRLGRPRRIGCSQPSYRLATRPRSRWNPTACSDGSTESRPTDHSPKAQGGVEIGACAQHCTSVGVGTIKIKSHDGVDRIATAGMVLAYRKNESALRMDPNVAESEGTLRRDRPRLSIAGNCIQTPVAVLRIDHGAVEDVIFTAAVLVHSVAYVGRRGRNLGRLTAGNEPSPQAGAASFISPDLQPVDVTPIDLHSGESLKKLAGRRSPRNLDPYGAIVTAQNVQMPVGSTASRAQVCLSVAATKPASASGASNAQGASGGFLLCERRHGGGSQVRCASGEQKKGARVACHLLVRLLPMVQDRSTPGPLRVTCLRLLGKAALRLSLVSHRRIWS